MSDMPKETLELLQTTAVNAVKAQTISLPDPRKYALQCGNSYALFAIPPELRKHKFSRLDDLLDMAMLWAGNDSNVVIWHDQAGVTLVLDDADRRDLGKFTLDVSPQFTILADLEKNKPELGQRELIKVLRLQLNLDPATIALFRRLDWSSSSGGTSQVERGRESLGRSIEAQVKGSQDIPDTIMVPIPLYTNIGEDAIYLIRCMVEFNAEQVRIQIVPEPDQLNYVLHAHQMKIRERIEARLEGDNAPKVYYGAP